MFLLFIIYHVWSCLNFQNVDAFRVATWKASNPSGTDISQQISTYAVGLMTFPLPSQRFFFVLEFGTTTFCVDQLPQKMRPTWPRTTNAFTTFFQQLLSHTSPGTKRSPTYELLVFHQLGDMANTTLKRKNNEPMPTQHELNSETLEKKIIAPALHLKLATAIRCSGNLVANKFKVQPAVGQSYALFFIGCIFQEYPPRKNVYG